MSKGINKVILIGNLGSEPESSGAAVKIRLATSESFKDKQSGAITERTEWHKVTFFGKLGEIVKQYLTKGSKVYIEGSLRTSKYQDKDGADRYSTEIIANTMQMLGAKGGANSFEPVADNASNSQNYSYDYMAIKNAASESDDDLPF